MDKTAPDLTLAALICSKLCHDLISPVGALTNGLEVLEDDDDEEMREAAMSLLETSAKAASARLQFARLALGAAGSAASQLSLEDAGAVANGYFQTVKCDLDWQVGAGLLPKDTVRLLLNLVMIGSESLPRGGTVRVASTGDEQGVTLRIDAGGPRAGLPEGMGVWLQARDDAPGLDSRSVQPYLTGLLARSLSAEISVTPGTDQVTYAAFVPRQQAAA